jgi:hypothetical protein
MKSLFRQRNELAHGKLWHSGDVTFESDGTPQLGRVQKLTPPWLRKATLGNAERHLKCVLEAADVLTEGTGYVRGLHISDTASFESVGVVDE